MRKLIVLFALKAVGKFTNDMYTFEQWEGFDKRPFHFNYATSLEFRLTDIAISNEYIKPIN